MRHRLVDIDVLPAKLVMTAAEVNSGAEEIVEVDGAQEYFPAICSVRFPLRMPDSPRLSDWGCFVNASLGKDSSKRGVLDSSRSKKT